MIDNMLLIVLQKLPLYQTPLRSFGYGQICIRLIFKPYILIKKKS